MKKLIIACFAIFALGTTAKAQTDVSINPIGLLFNSVTVTAEFGLSEDIGIEGGLNYNFNKYDIGDEEWKNSGFGVTAIGKYYFNPTRGINKWNIGPYLSFRTGSSSISIHDYDVKTTRLSLGFYGGYKVVSAKNIVFEIGMGFGKALVNEYKADDDTVSLTGLPILNIDVLGKLSVGYRFGGE